jgi:Tfp pilus assembly pilus retraction ATPase PilT
MISMDTYILRLLKAGDITPETAMRNSAHPDQMERLIAGQ